MIRIVKAQKIGIILDKLYPETPIPLNHKDSYTLLVAVMLSAQTTDKKVNEVTPRLFKQADTPSKMIKLGEKNIRGSPTVVRRGRFTKRQNGSRLEVVAE